MVRCGCGVHDAPPVGVGCMGAWTAHLEVYAPPHGVNENLFFHAHRAPMHPVQNPVQPRIRAPMHPYTTIPTHLAPCTNAPHTRQSPCTWLHAPMHAGHRAGASSARKSRTCMHLALATGLAPMHTMHTWRILALGRISRHAPMHTPFYFFIFNPPLEEMWFHAHPIHIFFYPTLSCMYFRVYYVATEKGINLLVRLTFF